jgi:FkbM family methyltransferase
MSLFNTLRFIATHPLNRANPAKSWLRFVAWQLGSRMVPGEVVVDWVGGAKFVVRHGEAGLTGNVYTGLHEFPEMGYLLHCARPTDLFVDVGANVGSYTLLACAAVGARGIALEPARRTFERLTQNIRLNGLEGKVTCLNLAAGGAPGSAALTSGLDCENHVVAADAQERGEQIEVAALDDILRNESPSLMKIDVEGYETLVLDGAAETLAKSSLHSVIIELNGSGRRYGFDEQRIIDRLRGHGFKTYTYDPLARALLPLEGKNLESGNTLFIRDEALVRERLASAPPVLIHGRRF